MQQSLAVLDATAHKNIRYSPLPDYSHAQGLFHAPLVYSEILQAALSYPILFYHKKSSRQLNAVALLGTKHTESNMFIDPKSGRWRPGCHIPVTATTYPFYAGPLLESGQQTILIDINAPHFSADDGRPLFDADGRPTPILEKIQARFEAIQKETELTDELISHLMQAELFQAKNLVSKNQDQTKTLMNEFFVVDPQRVAGMSAEKLVEFHKKGALPYIYAITSSLNNLNNMVLPGVGDHYGIGDGAQTTALPDNGAGIPAAKRFSWIATLAFVSVIMLSGILGYHLNPGSDKPPPNNMDQAVKQRVESPAAITNPTAATSDTAKEIESAIQPTIATTRPDNAMPTAIPSISEPKPAIHKAVIIQEQSTSPGANMEEIATGEPDMAVQPMATVTEPPTMIAAADNGPQTPEEEDAAFTPVKPSVATAAEEAQPEIANSPQKMASENKTATVPASDTVITPQPAPTPAPKPRANLVATVPNLEPDTMESLVARTRENILAAQLSKPEGDNALANIERMRSIDPDSPHIAMMREEVFRRYLELATWSTKRRAQTLLDRAEDLKPGDVRIEEAKSKLGLSAEQPSNHQ